MKPRLERLGPEARADVLVEHRRAVDHHAGAEPPLVHEQEAVIVVEGEPDAQVRAGIDVFPLGDPQQVSGHPEVHDEVALALEVGDQVLPPPPEGIDAAVPQLALDLARRHGSRPQRIEHLRALDRAPCDSWRQLPADRLYLGKLGHFPKRTRR